MAVISKLSGIKQTHYNMLYLVSVVQDESFYWVVTTFPFVVRTYKNNPRVIVARWEGHASHLWFRLPRRSTSYGLVGFRCAFDISAWTWVYRLSQHFRAFLGYHETFAISDVFINGPTTVELKKKAKAK